MTKCLIGDTIVVKFLYQHWKIEKLSNNEFLFDALTTRRRTLSLLFHTIAYWHTTTIRYNLQPKISTTLLMIVTTSILLSPLEMSRNFLSSCSSFFERSNQNHIFSRQAWLIDWLSPRLIPIVCHSSNYCHTTVRDCGSEYCFETSMTQYHLPRKSFVMMLSYFLIDCQIQ